MKSISYRLATATNPARIVSVSNSHQLRQKNNKLQTLRLLCTILAVLAFAFPLHAQTDFWSHPGGGYFDVGSNWQDGSAPTANQNAFFDIDATYQVDWDGFTGNGTNNNLTVADGIVTFVSIDGPTNTYTIQNDALIELGASLGLGFFAGDGHFLNVGHNLTVRGSLLLRSGSVSVDNDLVIGGLGTGGFFQLAFGQELETARLFVGINSTNSGSLFLSNGASMTTSAASRIAQMPGSNGTVTILNNSTWNSTDFIEIGSEGTGLCEVLSAADVTTNNTTNVGHSPGSTGTLNVDGNGSTWTSSNMQVGRDGNGTMNVENGGLVTVNNTIRVGNLPGSIGSVTVTDQDSELSVGTLIVGAESEDAVLVVQQDSILSSNSAIVGQMANSDGSIIIEDAAFWQNTGPIFAGSFGDGTLNIQAGGSVGNTDGIVGTNLGSNGLATVAGAGSQWNNSGELYVGFFGNGTLNIVDGAIVNNTNGYIGNATQGNGNPDGIGGQGAINVTGVGSQWNNSGDVSLGGDSFGEGESGSLIISAGALVTVGGTLEFFASNDPSTVALSDATLDITGELRVGEMGAGSVNVVNGGILLSNGGFIGNATSTLVIISGAGSQWINIGELTIQSVLVINNGGTVAVDGQVVTDGAIRIGGSGGTLIAPQGITNNKKIFATGSQSLIQADIANNDRIDVSGGISLTVTGAVTNSVDQLNIGLLSNGTTRFEGSYNGGAINGDPANNSNAQVVLAGQYRPGNGGPAITEFKNVSLEMESTNTTFIELGGTAGGQFDRIELFPFDQGFGTVEPNLTLAGNLQVNLVNGFTLLAGQSFEIINFNSAGTYSGTLAGLNEGDVVMSDNGFDLVISYFGGDGDDVVLTTDAQVLLGDVNLDGAVNLLDVGPFIDLLSSGAFQLEADINEDGAVNLLDVAPFVAILGGG